MTGRIKSHTGYIRERNVVRKKAVACEVERSVTTLKTAAKKTKDSVFLFGGKNRKMSEESEIISFFLLF